MRRMGIGGTSMVRMKMVSIGLMRIEVVRVEVAGSVGLRVWIARWRMGW